MQAALNHLSANQSRKNSKTPEKYAEAHVIELNDSGKYRGVFVHRGTGMVI